MDETEVELGFILWCTFFLLKMLDKALFHCSERMLENICRIWCTGRLKEYLWADENMKLDFFRCAEVYGFRYFNWYCGQYVHPYYYQ